MNIPREKLICCAEGLGLDIVLPNGMVGILGEWYYFNEKSVSILLTYAPGGIMDKMGWMAERFLNQDEEGFFIYNIGTCGDVVKHINNFNDIPAAAIDAYLDTLEGNKTSDEYGEKLQHVAKNVELMKSSLSMMEYELKKLKEGK